MKKILFLTSLILSALLLLSSCTEINVRTETSETVTAAEAQTEAQQTAAVEVDDPEDDEKITKEAFSVTSSGKVLEGVNSVYTISSAGEYTLTGRLSEGCIVVDAPDSAEITLILNNVSVTSSENAPILIKNASEVTVKSESETYNVINDARTGSDDALENDDEKNDAAIYAACDLKLSGKGTLIINSSYDNGIKTKDDLSIKNVTLKVTAPGNALKGNDSISIKSGDLLLTSTSSDGIKTSNSDVSSKGKQRGDITIEGGTVNIFALCDGISASHDVIISEAEAVCSVNIYTSTYSNQSGTASASSELYLIVPTSIYSQSYDYYAYFYKTNEDGTESGKWSLCEYETMVYSGRTAGYYGLLTKVPPEYKNVRFCIVTKGQTPDGETYYAASESEVINATLNGYLISKVSSGEIDGDWVQLSTGSGSNSNKSTYSSKGIKSADSINVIGGSVTVFSMDDGLHANSDVKLENGSYGAGSITVSGGTVTVKAADDGMHADGDLTISNGKVNVVESHEGLEANVITISGGNVTVYGNDDGMNACKGKSTPLINVTGGTVEVTTPSGDTDAVDSNGNFTMSGGFVIVKAGSSMGGVAGSVDVDGSITVTGGSIVAFGGICETPSGNSVNTYITNGTSFSSGDYTVVDGSGSKLFSFTLDGSYSSCWIASELIELNGSYKILKNSSAVAEWTQSSQTEGSSGSGFNPGGFGGFGGRGRP